MTVRSNFLLVASYVLVAGVVQGLQVHQVQVKLKYKCTVGLYENDASLNDYKTVKANFETTVRTIYRNDPNFYSTVVRNFNCLDNVRNMIVEFDIVTKNTTSFANAIQLLSDNLYGNSGPWETLGTVKEGFETTYVHSPAAEIEMKTDILVHHFCDMRYELKKLLAARIISSDGMGSEDASQVYFSRHQCNDIAARFQTATVRLYISNKLDFNPDKSLTILAYKVMDQMVYDGTTWKLGLGLHRQVDKVSLYGADTNEGFTNLEVVYIGVGAVIGLLLLVVVLIMIINRCCHCCDNDSNYYDEVEVGQKKNYEPKPFEMNSFSTNGYTNDAYVDEKATVVPMTFKYDEPVKSYTPPNYDSLDDEVKAIAEAPMYSNPIQEVFIPDEIEVVEVVNEVHSQPPEAEPQIGVYHDDQEISFGYGDDTSSSDESSSDDIDIGGLSLKLNDSNKLRKEFNSIERMMPTAMIYPADVARKNRKPGVFPWPEHRVVLSRLADDPSGDYINASLVKDSINGEPCFIATQGPLQTTVNDFWRLVWKEESKVIVMLTPLAVRGQELCYQYWPADSIARNYGDVLVQIKKKELKPNFVSTTVSVQVADSKRDIQIFRYMSWPQGETVPDSKQSFVAFLCELRDVVEKTENARPLFHCSSGIGVTAMVIAIIHGMKMMESRLQVNVKKIVRLLRKDLAGAVENDAQYQFIYEALHYYITYLEANQRM